MKKLIYLGLILLTLSTMQSCQRSKEDVVKDYVLGVKESLEKRDFKQFDAYNKAIDEYCTKLTDAEIEEIQAHVIKYATEYKIDSILSVALQEMQPELMMGDEPLEPGTAMPDTLNLEQAPM